VGRVIKDFAKENDKLVVKALAVGGKMFPASDIDRLATLPTKDQAIAMLMGTMKAPITKFVGTLAAPHTKLVRTVKAVADKQGEAA
jgi:large subunit ribosomal protein L10